SNSLRRAAAKLRALPLNPALLQHSAEQPDPTGCEWAPPANGVSPLSESEIGVRFGVLPPSLSERSGPPSATVTRSAVASPHAAQDPRAGRISNTSPSGPDPPRKAGVRLVRGWNRSQWVR